MTSEVAGDPTTLPGLRAEHENGPRRPGASPPMRMTASWFDPQRIDRIQGRGARSAPPPLASSPRILSAAIAASRGTSSNQVPLSAMVAPTGAPSPPIAESANQRCEVGSLPSRRILPSCSRGRQGRCAPLTRWPEGAILDRRCARRRWEERPGRKNGLRRGPNKRIGERILVLRTAPHQPTSERVERKRSVWRTSRLTTRAPYKGPWYGASSRPDIR
jgi:hypothetical protein